MSGMCNSLSNYFISQIIAIDRVRSFHLQLQFSEEKNLLSIFFYYHPKVSGREETGDH